MRLVAISDPVDGAEEPMGPLHLGSLESVTAAFFVLAVFARCISYAPLASCLAQCPACDPFQPQQPQTLPGLNNIQLNGYWELRFALPIAGTLLAFVQQRAGTYRV